MAVEGIFWCLNIWLPYTGTFYFFTFIMAINIINRERYLLNTHIKPKIVTMNLDCPKSASNLPKLQRGFLRRETTRIWAAEISVVSLKNSLAGVLQVLPYLGAQPLIEKGIFILDTQGKPIPLWYWFSLSRVTLI